MGGFSWGSARRRPSGAPPRAPAAQAARLGAQRRDDRVERAAWDWNEVERNPFWCPDAGAAARWEELLTDVRKRGSSVGAVVEVVASGATTTILAKIGY